jgi:signal transduction histidine kinase
VGEEVDQRSRGNDPPLRDQMPLSWPLVERRRVHAAPPGGVERRASARPPTPPPIPSLAAAPLWPFRLLAVAGAIAHARSDYSWDNWRLIGATVIVSVYAIVTCLRPVPYRDDSKVRMRIIGEQALHLIVVLGTGAWSSPFALCLIPSGMLAGFAAGGFFSAELAVAAIAAVTAKHVNAVGFGLGLRDGSLWTGLLGLVAFTSGLTHRAGLEAARQQQLALDRVSRLAEANSLLFSLQRVAQTLPASLDLDDVLDSTVQRMQAMVRHDALSVFLVNATDRAVEPIRALGFSPPPSFQLDRLPEGLRAAMDSPRTVRIDDLSFRGGVSASARSGLYAALRARGALVGLIAVEADQTDSFGQQQAEIVHGLTEPFGIAIDNARMFGRIRTLAADEERSRIARDLHDHIGSSLAMIGFEIDRARSIAADGGEVVSVLEDLRTQVTAVVSDVRDTLFDLRTEVTDTYDLASIVRDFLTRVQQRTGIITDHDVRVAGRLPLLQEREMWQIAREAITNVERHSQAKHLTVTVNETPTSASITVRDDGVGLGVHTSRADSYGIIGMRERAARIGAELSIRPSVRGGTEIQVHLRSDDRRQRWDSR